MVLQSILFISAKYNNNMMVVVSYRPGGTTNVQIVYNVLYELVNCICTLHVNMYHTSSVPIRHTRVQAHTLHVYVVGKAFVNLAHLLLVYIRTAYNILVN